MVAELSTARRSLLSALTPSYITRASSLLVVPRNLKIPHSSPTTITTNPPHISCEVRKKRTSRRNYSGPPLPAIVAAIASVIVVENKENEKKTVWTTRLVAENPKQPGNSLELAGFRRVPVGSIARKSLRGNSARYKYMRVR